MPEGPPTEARHASHLAAEALKEAEARGREAAGLRADVNEHSRHFLQLNGQIGDLAKAMQELRTDLGDPPFDLTPLTAATRTLLAGLKKIEEREDTRVKEAHADRRSVKIALYSFATALTASGIGALLVHFLNK
jgi:hypothetical protein